MISRTTFASSIVAGIMVLAAVPGPAHSQAATNRMERRQDRRELRQDHRRAADDRRDRMRIDRIASDFEKVRSSADPVLIAQVDKRVLAYIAGELGESIRESSQGRAEVRRDRRELRSDRREIKRDRAALAPPRVRVDDKHDLRDDRRDLRDDRRDARREKMQRKRLVEIRREWTKLSGRIGQEAMAARARLLAELQGMARLENQDNRRELREDRRELREDRRETREDRRQGG